MQIKRGDEKGQTLIRVVYLLDSGRKESPVAICTVFANGIKYAMNAILRKMEIRSTIMPLDKHNFLCILLSKAMLLSFLLYLLKLLMFNLLTWNVRGIISST